MIDEIRVDPQTFDFDLLEFKTRSTSRSLPSKAQRNVHKLQVRTQCSVLEIEKQVICTNMIMKFSFLPEMSLSGTQYPLF